MRNLCRNLFCFTLVVAMLCIHATATALPVWGSVQEQMAILYLPGVSLEDELTCQVGNIQAVVSNKLPITALDVPMETIVVLDNSFSIAIEERARIGELLEDLIANRLDGEAYTIATIGDQVTYLCQNVSDYTQLKTVIDGIQYYNQNTQLTDGLYQILEELHRADDGVFRRVVLIADGVDDKQIGYTKAELDSLIQTLKYPIYTIGCTNHSDTGNEQLQNLFSLSRITTGASYYFAEMASWTGIMLCG